MFFSLPRHALSAHLQVGRSPAGTGLRLTTDVGVTVVMFRAGDPGSKDAFDAAEVLKKYSQ